MGNGQGTETQEQTDLTPLAQRIENLSAPIRKTIQVKTTAPCSPRLVERCVICRSLIMDGDPTGITCGNPRCLSELGKQWAWKIAELGEAQEATEGQIKHITSRVKDIMISLGLDPNKSPDNPYNLPEMCEQIQNQIKTIQEAVKKLEKEQKQPT